MTFKDLVLRVDRDNVLKELIKEYPDQIGCLATYLDILEKLKVTESVFTEDMILLIYPEEDCVAIGQNTASVVGYCKKDKEVYAIDFTAWDEWLGFEVCIESLDFYGEDLFVAHCLYEMTFYSFDEEEISEQVDMLKEISEELESGNCKTYSMEEVYKEMGLEMPPEKTEEEIENDRTLISIIHERNIKVREYFLKKNLIQHLPSQQ